MEKLLLRKVQWKHLLIFFVCLMSVNQIHAQYYDFSADNDGVTIYYRIKGKNAIVVSGDNKYAGNVMIPSNVAFDGKDYSVTEISSFAFNGCVDLENIVLPPSLEAIGTYAFAKCTSLRTISIPNNVEAIGYNAFAGCSNINVITLPSSLRSIEHNTFDGCRNLRAIVIPYGVRRIGSNAFNGCRMMKSVSIPNSVNTIEAFAFNGCASITNLSLPDQLTSLEQYVFADCSGLSDVVIPVSVNTIENDAFMNCSGLKTILIPSSITYIGNWAFTGCKAIQSVTTEIDEPFAIGDYVFERDVKKNAVLHVPYGLKNIYSNTSGWDFSNIEEEPQPLFSLVLWGQNGRRMATYALKDKPKIKFLDSELIISSSSIDVEYHSINEISKFTYEDNSESGIFNILTNETMFKYNGEYLQFPFLKANTMVNVYSINGACIFNKTIHYSGTYAFPLSHLQTGVYLIKVDGVTFKVSKK